MVHACGPDLSDWRQAEVAPMAMRPGMAMGAVSGK